TSIDESQPLVLFHPVHTFRKKKVTHFRAINLLVPVFREGKRVYELPSLEEIRKYHREQLSLFWEEYLRILNPEEYPVDLSRDLWEGKQDLLNKIYASIREENGNWRLNPATKGIREHRGCPAHSRALCLDEPTEPMGS